MNSKCLREDGLSSTHLLLYKQSANVEYWYCKYCGKIFEEQ